MPRPRRFEEREIDNECEAEVESANNYANGSVWCGKGGPTGFACSRKRHPPHDPIHVACGSRAVDRQTHVLVIDKWIGE